MAIRKIYGPPGTGKTRRLTELAIRAAYLYGPKRVCALTFTRAGAEELRGRIAASLGLNPPSDEWSRRKYYAAHLPWVGTIHSLCYRLIDRQPVVSARDLTAFARD